jgi:2-amino-4-hydroxy-6-hydroxymethyldihydropteridine diphosphokinase
MTMTASHDAYFALGSNIQPEANLRAAVEALSAIGRVVAVSSVYDTTPIGSVGDPRFLNAVLHLETELDAEGCVRAAHRIEDHLGRVRGEDRNAARTIDIDLIVFDDEIGEVNGRPLPSPEILERAFVAIPLAQVAPELTIPGTGRTSAQIASEMRAHPPDMVLSPLRLDL